MHGSACSIRWKNTPSIIVKNSNVTNNISHLLFENVYKNRDNMATLSFSADMRSAHLCWYSVKMITRPQGTGNGMIVWSLTFQTGPM